MNPDLPSVAFNPWLSCGLWMTVHVYLTGMAWSWLIRDPEQDQPVWSRWLFASARSVVLSLIATLLSSLLLAGAGWFTPSVQRGTTALLILIGLE